MNFSTASLILIFSWILTSTCRAQVEVYKQDGDLIIGGLIPVHFFNDSSRLCEGLRDLSALRRVEAMHYAISKINNNSSLFGDLTIGYEIYDTCSSPRETLKNALNFIPPLRTDDNIIGVVGPQRSSSSVQATNLLGIYNISIVSFLSTSDELSDSDKFPYFIRTVPPDKFQVNIGKRDRKVHKEDATTVLSYMKQVSVITDIMNKYQWKYVAFLYSDDTYGKNAEAEFRMQAQDHDICIGYTKSISGSRDQGVYGEVVANLLELRQKSLASVVVLFTQVETARKIFHHASQANVTRDFIWIGSDGWGNYDLTPVRGAEESALGAFTIVPKAEIHSGFNSYFDTALHTSLNPWIPEYFQACNCTSFDEIPLPPYESVVIDSVEVIARGLHDMKRQICNESLSKSQCKDILIKNRRVLRDYFLDVEFESNSNGLVSFTKDGDSNGRYDIRYLLKNDVSYRFITNGTWLENGDPKLVFGPVPWYLEEETGRNTYTGENIPKSVCSDPCNSSQVTRMTLQDCCWTCEACEDNEIIVENECVSCFFKANETYMWPNPSLAHCIPLDNLRLVHKVENVIFLTIALLGIIVAVVIAYLYIKNRDKKLIRASSRELGYIILVGIFLAYVSAILYCIPAHTVACYLRRIVPSVATTFIYVSLLTMTVRLYRIFAAGKKTAKRPKFISPKSQVFLTLVISVIPIAWGLAWIIIHPPEAVVIPPTKKRQIIEKMCVVSKEHRIGQLAWDVVVVLVNCYFAFRTRSLPANYNQTRFIAFSVFSTLIVLIAFAPAFFTTDISSQQDLYSALGYIIQPTVVLILIFIAKIYAIYFVNEEDQQVISNRPSMMQSSDNIPRPSPRPSTVSTYATNASIPATPRSGSVDHDINGVFTETTDVQLDFSSRIYKSTSRHLNTDKISTDSIEIHSVVEDDGQRENETGPVDLA